MSALVFEDNRACAVLLVLDNKIVNDRTSGQLNFVDMIL